MRETEVVKLKERIVGVVSRPFSPSNLLNSLFSFSSLCLCLPLSLSLANAKCTILFSLLVSYDNIFWVFYFIFHSTGTPSLASTQETPTTKEIKILFLSFSCRKIPFAFLGMGDHFVLLVDRLLTESTIEAAIESNNRLRQAKPLVGEDSMAEVSSQRVDKDIGSSPNELVECRICQDEDEVSNLEIPCSCCGSLKYAHRKCVQRWCNEKGDTICEICREQYKPGYTAPPPLFHYGGNFRTNWEIPRRDLPNTQFITMVTADRGFLDSSLDEYYTPSSRSLLCCRLLSITFMVLLVLRHTLPIIVSGAGEYSLTLFTLLMLRTIGILLPVYIMVKAFTAIQRRRHQQDPRFSLATTDEENELPQLQRTRPRFIPVR